MQKLSSATVYQLSLDDLKEALTLYMQHKYNTEVDIQSLDEVMKTEDYRLSYNCIPYLDGIKITAKV